MPLIASPPDQLAPIDATGLGLSRQATSLFSPIVRITRVWAPDSMQHPPAGLATVYEVAARMTLAPSLELIVGIGLVFVAKLLDFHSKTLKLALVRFVSDGNVCRLDGDDVRHGHSGTHNATIPVRKPWRAKGLASTQIGGGSRTSGTIPVAGRCQFGV
jgi:hypothetical protein